MPVKLTHADCHWDGEGIHWVALRGEFGPCLPIESIAGVPAAIVDCIPTETDKVNAWNSDPFKQLHWESRDIPKMQLYRGDPLNNPDWSPPKQDMVNHPPHYNQPGRMETIEVIKEFLGGETPAMEGYLKGQVIKYLSRAGLKGDKLEDLKKAQWYLNYLVTLVEGKNG